MNAGLLRYAISDRNSAHGTGAAPLCKQAQSLAEEGAEFFQLREKDLPAAEMAALARAILAELSGSTTKLLINGRADVAVAVGAAGVHLSSSRHELTVEQVRRVYASANRLPPIVTVSCHSLDEVEPVGADLPTAILFGPVFSKTVRGELVKEGIGLTLLREACRLAGPVPVFALGGVTKGNTASCLEYGAQGVAGIRLFQRG